MRKFGKSLYHQARAIWSQLDRLSRAPRLTPVPVEAPPERCSALGKLPSRHSLWLCAATGLLSAASLLPAGSLRAAEPTPEAMEFFEKEIRPLLAQRCYECHGEGDKIKGGLRLTSRTSILAGGESGPAVELDKPAQSLLIEAVRYQGIEMPPKAKLPEDDIKKLARWVELGMPWPEGSSGSGSEPEHHEVSEFSISDVQRSHWSFQPVRAAAPPVVKDQAWPAGPIDRFVLAALEAHDLAPNAPADKWALLRRVTFDMTGLPPTPAELQDFLADESPQAFERVVDRLLASPQYGERWGRHWLDVVRYADSAGETADFPVPEAYKYRNYVIDSFNRDKPYDEFLREQIAGDILAAEGPPEKYAERVTATGYLAISRRFGFDSENYYHLTIADTLDTVGRSVLGLSIGCARCHDHKYDPLSAKDYYALYGIFSSTRYAFPGSEEKQRPRDFVPMVPPDQVAALTAARQAELARLDGELATLNASLKEQLAAVGQTIGDFEASEPGGAVPAPWTPSGTVTILPEAQSPFVNVAPHGMRGVRLPNDNANNYLLQNIGVRTPATHDVLYLNVDFRNVSVEAGGSGHYRFCICQGAGTSYAVEVRATGESFFLFNGATPEKLSDLKLGEWYNLQLALDLDARTYSGALTSAAGSVPFSGKGVHPSWNGTVDTIFVDSWELQAGVRPARDIDNFFVSDKAFAPAGQPVAAPVAGTPEAEAAAARRAEVVAKQAKISETQKAVAALTAQHTTLSSQPPCEMAYGVVEGTPANARIQKRGEPLRLGEEVPRRFLEVLGGDRLPPSAGSGRRELADWLTRTSNPLTARVMANRLWHYHFGKGLVATTSDFGVRGRKPTHPELLDYLADRLMAGGWSLKALHREILVSHAYQVSSLASERALELDPGNQWLGRFDRQRLDAESIRDATLAISGQLDVAPGGAHPFPPVSSWGFSQHGPFKAVYETPKRSVYLMTQRIQRHPFLGLFDGVDANVSTGERTATITPTQALFLMNSPFIHEQSGHVADRLLKEAADTPTRLTWLYQRAYGRPPTDSEQQAAAEFLQHYGERLQSTGVPADQTLRPVWASLARVVLTSNEFLYVD